MSVAQLARGADIRYAAAHSWYHGKPTRYDAYILDSITTASLLLTRLLDAGWLPVWTANATHTVRGNLAPGRSPTRRQYSEVHTHKCANALMHKCLCA